MQAFEISGKIDKDGKLITTDSLPIRDKEVRVVLMVEEEEGQERREWINASMKGLNNAYGEDEPVYSENMIKDPNPDYYGHEKG